MEMGMCSLHRSRRTMASTTFPFHFPFQSTVRSSHCEKKAQKTPPSFSVTEGFHSRIKLGRRELFLSSLSSLVCPASCNASQSKTTRLPISKIKEIIENDIKNGQYYVTGDLTKEIYDDNCRFVDPTTDVRGLDTYIAAIRILFDPKSSYHELIGIEVTGPNTIEAKWRLEGYLKFPWHPHILPYEGTTVYQVNGDGLIYSHQETWNISVWTAFLQSLTPS